MRAKATWLAVLAVAAIGVAAGVDALRGEATLEPVAQTRSEPLPPGSPETTPVPHAPATRPAFAGTLYYTDRDCELRALDLSGSSPVEAPNWDECTFVLSPDGQRVAGAGSGWDPHSDPLIGRLFQADGGAIQVSTNGGPQDEPIPGGAAAWRQDGTLTYFANGVVRAWPSGTVLLSRKDLPASAAGVSELAWLGPGLLAVIVFERPPDAPDTLALFEGRRLVAAVPGQSIHNLRASPTGELVAASSVNGPLLVDRTGRVLPVPGSGGTGAIAFSPDGSWAAVAAADRVVIFRPGQAAPTTWLEITAGDLAWRGDGGSALVPGRDAVLWLTDVGATGRLYVTQENEGRCRLRVLELPGLGWGPGEPGRESPCRFTVDGGVAVPEAETPRPGGGRPGTCRDIADCAFAWTPDGRPTFVEGGELFAGTPGGRRKLLLSAAGLAEIFDEPAELEEVAWLDRERFWAVVRRKGAEGLAFMSTDALVYSPWFAAPRVQGLHVSSTGMVAASSDRGVVIFDGGGRRHLNFTNGLDVTWAPGDLIAAVSTRREILFVSPVTGEVVSFPLEVADLEWVRS